MFLHYVLKKSKILIHRLSVHCIHPEVGSAITTSQCELGLTFKKPSPPPITDFYSL